jgi:hypothetical protein
MNNNIKVGVTIVSALVVLRFIRKIPRMSAYIVIGTSVYSGIKYYPIYENKIKRAFK